MLQTTIIQAYTKVNKKNQLFIGNSVISQGTDKDSILRKCCFLGK